MADFRATLDDGGMFDRLARPETTIADELVPAVRRASFRGEGASKGIVRSKNRIDLGQLINSIAADAVVRLGRTVRGGWGASAAHAIFVLKGRRPGAAMPPKGVLLPWMARHGKPDSAEFVIRRGIARRGIPALDFLKDALPQVEPTFFREVQAAGGRALARLVGGR